MGTMLECGSSEAPLATVLTLDRFGAMALARIGSLTCLTLASLALAACVQGVVEPTFRPRYHPRP